MKAIEALRREEQLMGKPAELLRATRSTIFADGQTREVWFLIYRIEYNMDGELHCPPLTETRWAVYVDGKLNTGGIIS